MILGSLMVVVNSRDQHSGKLQGGAPSAAAAIPMGASLNVEGPIFSRLGRVATLDGAPPLDPHRRRTLLEEIRSRVQGQVHEASHSEEWRASRGRPHAVLEGRRHFLTKTVRAVHAIPEKGDIASNYARLPKKESLYFINGMTSSPADVKQHVDNLLRITGRPVTAIINHQKAALLNRRNPGVARSVWNATQGFVSFKMGREVERSAAQELERAMVDHVNKEHPLHIVAHSQGTIILRNALEHVLGKESPLDDQGKAQLKKLLRVSTYGAAEHYFPVGVSVQEYAHREDPIVKITNVLADIRQGFRSVVGGLAHRSSALPNSVAKGISSVASSLDSEVPLRKAPTVSLQGEHSFVSYVDRMTDFFIAKHGSPDRWRGARLAQGLASSISSGDLSDKLHGTIIEELLRQGDRTFAREFLVRVKGDMIGLYRVPHMDELRKLAQ
jgi:hypothetical protein